MFPLLSLALFSTAWASSCSFPNFLSTAWTLGTGIGQQEIQTCISELEQKGINKEPLSLAEQEWLVGLYQAMSVGGRLAIVTRQTGRMMKHYLRASGEDYPLKKRIFLSLIHISEPTRPY